MTSEASTATRNVQKRGSWGSWRIPMAMEKLAVAAEFSRVTVELAGTSRMSAPGK